MHHGDDIPQPGVADVVPVVRGHRIIGMAHKMVHGDLVARLSGLCLERVAKTVKSTATIDVQQFQKFREFLRHGINCSPFCRVVILARSQ